MKDISATYASVKKNLDSSVAPAVAADATKLQALFKETDEFWTPFKTKDAVDTAKNAQDGAAAIVAAAKANNIQKAQTSYNNHWEVLQWMPCLAPGTDARQEVQDQAVG